jgi:hypothetical protein
MNAFQQTRQRIINLLATGFFVVLLIHAGDVAYAQVVTSTLSGTVQDTTGAVVPGATVTVVNRSNKSSRSTRSNSEGIFTFPSLNAGDYDLAVQITGFEQFRESGIHLDPGDTRTLTDVKIAIGSVHEVIAVDAQNNSTVEDTGERSSIITSDDLQKLSLEGREVTELLKILPGAAIGPGGNNGGNQASGAGNTTFDPGQVQLGGGAGNYSMSGAPTNGVAIRSDGVNLTDPGTNSGSLQNINAESTAEVKVSTSNFGADTANGPVVISALGKSGGSTYHGSLYAYARTYQLNANDAFAKGTSQLPRPPDRYVYPGATLGGPVKIPGTDFNHAKKLTFFVSGEEYAQRNAYAYGSASSASTHALVPTAGMRAGDFGPAEIQKYLPPGAAMLTVDQNGNPALVPTAAFGTTFQSVTSIPRSDSRGNPISCRDVPGDCLAGKIDPGTAAIFKLLPLPNTPNGQTVAGGYNYSQLDLVNNDLWQARGRLDYALNSRGDKIYAVYNVEMGATSVPQATGYFASGDSGGLNTPGGSNRNNHTHSGTINYTQVFSRSLTNEIFASVTYSDHYDTPGNKNLLNNSAIGYPYHGAYANGSSQFPTLLDYGYDGLPLGIFPDYSFGPLLLKDFVPAGGDNLSKLLGRHTLKFGVNVERPVVDQTQANVGSTPTNGGLDNYYVSPTFYLPPSANANPTLAQTYHSTCYSGGDAFCGNIGQYGGGNALANFAVGEFADFYQANMAPLINLYNWTTSLYATDDFKVTGKLSVTFGLRAEHLGRWLDNHGLGVAVWRPDLYAGDGDASTNIPLPGFRWKANDSTGQTPLAGFASRAFYYEPRVGFAFDVFGTGKTMLSGGYGQYRFHDGQQDLENAAAAPAGLRTVKINNSGNPGLTFGYVSGLNLSSTSATGSFDCTTTGSCTTNSTSIYGVDGTDSETPLTSTYSFTVTQQMPADMVFSIGYVGNTSSYLLDDGANQGLYVDNVNAIPVGSFFRPDPNPKSSFYGTTVSPINIPGISASQQNDWRPFPEYASIQVLSHKLYANYNGLQLTLNRNKGSLFYGINYTWSKAIGVRGGYFNGIPGDAFNLRNDYGPLSTDRSQIFNASYGYSTGTLYRGFRVLRPFVNNFLISGYTGLQSGPNLQATNYVSNFSLQGNTNQPGGNTALATISNLTYLGTPDVQLQPLLTCNPTGNLKSHQYVNGNCFAVPTPGGQNGPLILPYIHGPAYFQSDLTLAKTVHISESQSLEMRVAGFNFLNHPVRTFSSFEPTATQLLFTPPTGGGPVTQQHADFGFANLLSGRRVVELGAKYIF